MDDHRFQALFAETYPALIRYAYNRGHRGAEAEDIIASTYEVAWRRLADVPGGDQALPWLLAVARNLSRNAVRKTTREQFFTDALAEPSEVEAGGMIDEAITTRDELLRGLMALTELDRELLLMVAWDGLEPAQAGDVLGLRAGAARSRLHRARNKLAALIRTQNPRAAREPIASTAQSEKRQEERR